MILAGKFGYGYGEGEAWFAEKQPAVRSRKIKAQENPSRQLKKIFSDLEKRLKSEKEKLSKGEEYLNFPLSILRDPVLWEEIQAELKKRKSVLEAVQHSFQKWENRFRKLDDPYLRLRAQDLADLRSRILEMLGDGSGPKMPQGPFVAVAKDLFVTDLLQWRRFPLQGVCLEEGNEAAHGVLLAKALGIPVAGGVSGIIRHCASGDSLIVNGKKVHINERPQKPLSKPEAMQTPGSFFAKDGSEVVLRANVQLQEEIRKAQQAGAKGIGLFRTEFLWISKELSLEEETGIYREAIETFYPEKVVFRLVDLGSDKPFPRVSWPKENNPALGWRGLQFLLDHPKILRRQLNALFRAASNRTLCLILPMVRAVEEIHQFLKIMQPFKEKRKAKTRVGVMIETPSSAYLLDSLPREISFASIGTNDLLQYFFAIDRIHPEIKGDPLHPLFLRFLKEIVEKASQAGKSLSICGEMAGDPKALPVLLRLGLREFSLSIPKIAQIANQLRKVSLF